MTERPQIYIYTALAAGFTVMAYLYAALRTERRRIDDLVGYFTPLREYTANRSSGHVPKGL